AWPGDVSADTTATTTVENSFPRQVVFNLSATSDVEVTEAVLNYRITGRNTSARGFPETFTPGTDVSADVEVETGSGNSYIPVGSEFVYSWELTLADGTTYTSPEETFLYLPPGHEWESVGDEIIQVYYHGDNAAIAQEYVEAGHGTYDRIA